jgi:hypothetical protein
MNESTFETCKHEKQAPREVLDSLPESQGGTGRHKCVVCACQRSSETARFLTTVDHNVL